MSQTNNQSLVGNVNNTNVYYINDGAVPFYLSIPNKEQVTMVINLLDNPDEINASKVGIKEIQSKVIEKYQQFNKDDIAVITPIFEGAFMRKVQENAGPNYTSYLNKAIGYLINKSYSTLKGNGKEVLQKIVLNNNETYKAFNEMFASMYPDRIQLMKYDTPIVQAPNIQVASVTPPQEQQIANTLNIALENNEEVAQKTEEREKVKVKKLTKNREPGFISYVLLGVIVAILSLIGLYLLL